MARREFELVYYDVVVQQVSHGDSFHWWPFGGHLEKTIIDYWAIGLMSRVFTNGPGDRVFNPRSSHTKDSNAALINSQHYKVKIKGKIEQPRERSSVLPNTSV